MSDPPFDPYYKWLGIPPKDQPPHFYRLLGIEDFETDVDVIENAAARLISQLRTYAIGPNSEDSHKLLNEVASARVTLLNPARKAEYDQSLTQSGRLAAGEILDVVLKKPLTGNSGQDQRLADSRQVHAGSAVTRVGGKQTAISRKWSSSHTAFAGMIATVVFAAVLLLGMYRGSDDGASKKPVAMSVAGESDTTSIASDTPVPPATVPSMLEPESAVASSEIASASTPSAPTSEIPLLNQSGNGDASAEIVSATPPSIVAEPKPGPEPSFEAKVLPSEMTNSIGMELKLIAAGTFMMGEGDNAHEVTLTKYFYLGIHEVTQAQYEAVMETNPSEFKGASNPAEGISWGDAVRFCQELAGLPAEREAGRRYRLPTEAEWEYACRAGTTTVFSFGDDAGELINYGWFDKNADGMTHPVGEKLPNSWGLYDMHGNVWEWCLDWFGDFPSELVTDPVNRTPGLHRVIRGGGWHRAAAAFSIGGSRQVHPFGPHQQPRHPRGPDSVWPIRGIGRRIAKVTTRQRRVLRTVCREPEQIVR